jgi:hypothetical protein
LSKINDLRGRVFNRLTVIDLSHTKNGKVFWNVKCDCGNFKTVVSSSLLGNNAQSCGCLQKENMTTHGKSKTHTYKVWVNMLDRINNKNNEFYYCYGGRGIKVCDKRLSFEGFYEDMGDRPKGLTLDRINNNGNYCKENCRWATDVEQNNNTSKNINILYNDKTQTLAQWSEELKMDYNKLYARLFTYKWSIERAFTE